MNKKSYQYITQEFYARLLKQYLLKYPLSNGKINQGNLYKSVWHDVNPNQLLLEFNALITITRSAFNIAILYYNKIEKETQKQLKLIEQKSNE